MPPKLLSAIVQEPTAAACSCSGGLHVAMHKTACMAASSALATCARTPMDPVDATLTCTCASSLSEAWKNDKATPEYL